MDIMIILGLVVAAGAFYFGVPELRNDYGIYIHPASFILVFFGTIASTMISTSSREFKNILVVFRRLIVKPHRLEPHEAVKVLVHVAEKAQSTSKQALANEGKGVGDGFLERALGLVGAGLDKDFIRRTLETDISEIQRRHMMLINTIRTMGSYAPMFGMAGTVVGVVQVLKNVTDIQNIVAGMSLALLTTLYGLIFSSIIFIPVANKLRTMSARELLTKEIIMEGVLAILDKEIPLKVEKYLTAYLETKYKQDEEA